MRVRGVVAACLAMVVCAGSASASTGRVTDGWSDEVVARHNAARAKYGAGPLTWNAELYADTLRFAQACEFRHSGGGNGQYGENLYAATSRRGKIGDAVTSWLKQADDYDYGSPGYSAATGSFTQLVWKSTTQVVAAVVSCPAGTVLSTPSTFVVARYTPPGNYEGEFAENVGRPGA
ncbi:CAP family protein [Actinosynnema sp. NPDC020468]|uniref:CAP family protein n=1 Tax=Actinosynnema sp. NPDC020468 TaxID=3154488 RepID=UPI0033E5A753